MSQNLVIVESPAKAKTIERFLGKDFVVKSSYGHIRDLAKKDLGIDKEKNYKPKYLLSTDKRKVVKELKDAVKVAQTVWLASDEDREGEAIAWHLYEVLDLKNKDSKRIVFHEITPKAIKNAIENPRDIDQNLVNAQQARRILDRLVGFELSPLLWKKVKPSLSAGRVQSVAVRLLVEREREILSFVPTSAFKVQGNFDLGKNKGELLAELNKRLKSQEEVDELFGNLPKSEYKIHSVQKRPGKKSPAPPFTTSTLQQEAARKFGFSVSQTMTLAQKLYEAGHITYMRTDSVNLSDDALGAITNQVKEIFGEDYHQFRKYSTKTKGAQEAHEAIRPTYIQKRELGGAANEQKLYDLIWKRAVASQMADAKLEKTTVTIPVNNTEYKFTAQGEVLLFDGFLKLYMESTDDESKEDSNKLLPPLQEGQALGLNKVVAKERFASHPPRFTEASLVKKMEELGIGRPSTYAPTISTVQKRGYVVKEDREGKQRDVRIVKLENNKINHAVKTENYGQEKAKLFPTDIGMVVNDYLVDYFEKVMDYSFTASVEKDFDEIASGKKVWNNMIDEFYKPFHNQVEYAEEKSERKVGERILGEDPETGKPISVRIGRYGPMAQIGTAEDEEKPKFASLMAGQHLETITLEEALELFKLPRDLGLFEDKKVVAAIGRFGPYVRHDGKFVSLKKGIDDPYSIQLDRAIELIVEKREADKNKLINTFDDGAIKVQNGRYGPYITFKRKNYRIPKSTDPKKMTKDDCMKIIEGGTKKKTTKKTNKKKE